MAPRPPDIVSPVTNTILPQKVTIDDARKAGRSAYDKPTADNIVMLFIDHQIGLMARVRDFSSLAASASSAFRPCCANSSSPSTARRRARPARS